MPTVKTVTPLESSGGTDPVSRLVAVLTAEGFTPIHDDADWKAFGEQVYHRTERILFVRGETVFVLIDFPDLDEHVLQRAVENVTETFRAKSKADKAFSVFQATTVYVCLVARNGSPHTAALNRFVTSAGGAIIIPVVIVPDINQVVYPSMEESLGNVSRRVQYLQYVLGERRDSVDIHRQTIQTLWISAGFVGILVLLAIITAIF